MKKVLLLLFFIIGFSWVTICIPSVFVFGRLLPLPDARGSETFPPPLSGMALTGMRVYGSLGCMACHTQQIRQLSLTSADVNRLWGRRGALMRDTLSYPVYFPGALRVGPDLSNYGFRQRDPAANHRLLYTSQKTGMPSYAFLYRVQKIQGARSARALVLSGRDRPPDGYEVIPTYEAECLVAYLLSLKPVEKEE